MCPTCRRWFNSAQACSIARSCFTRSTRASSCTFTDRELLSTSNRLLLSQAIVPHRSRWGVDLRGTTILRCKRCLPKMTRKTKQHKITVNWWRSPSATSSWWLIRAARSSYSQWPSSNFSTSKTIQRCSTTRDCWVEVKKAAIKSMSSISVRWIKRCRTKASPHLTSFNCEWSKCSLSEHLFEFNSEQKYR